MPFIVKWKNHVKKNAIDSTSVLSSVDLLPTFANLAKIEVPKDYKIDGENIATIFDNKNFNIELNKSNNIFDNKQLNRKRLFSLWFSSLGALSRNTEHKNTVLDNHCL